MIKFIIFASSFRLFGLVGSGLAILGAAIAGAAYRGSQGERFSPLNHYVSELGEVGVSRLAWVFNLSLIFAGLCLILACTSLGFMLPGALAKIGMAVGIICSISLSLVGVFPMNKENYHGAAAMTFFRAGLLMVVFFSLAIALQSNVELILPRVYWLAGLPATLSFSGFLVLISIKTNLDEPPLRLDEVKRPKVWLLVIIEWLIFVTIVAWFLVIVVGL